MVRQESKKIHLHIKFDEYNQIKKPMLATKEASAL